MYENCYLETRTEFKNSQNLKKEEENKLFKYMKSKKSNFPDKVIKNDTEFANSMYNKLDKMI